jgi:Bacterial PH domain
MAPIEFRAPWSKELRAATITYTALLVTIVLVGVFVGAQMPLAAAAVVIGLPLALLVVSLLFRVRGYVLTEEAIVVRRGGWDTRLPLHGLRSISGDAQAMQRSIRLFGNGGLFSFAGVFWNRKLRRYRALATDPSRAVVLRYPKRTVVITPHDPQHFIMRAGTLLKTAGFR